MSVPRSDPNNLAAANYDFTYINGTLTVTPALLTATADNQSRVYNTANPTFTETVTGYVNGDTRRNYSWQCNR